MGRPEKEVRLHLAVDREERRMLEELAEQGRSSMSAVVRRLVAREYLLIAALLGERQRRASVRGDDPSGRCAVGDGSRDG
jgi:hypothetical protein